VTYPNDEDQEELEDREFPDEADVDGDDSTDTVPCRHCGRPVYAGAEVCTHCNQYVSDEDSPPPRKPHWFIIGVMVTVAIVVLWILLRL
jgi:predicted nucleic acid-binding Zn ribbon protein